MIDLNNEHELRNCFEAEVMITKVPLALRARFDRLPSGRYNESYVELAWQMFKIGKELGEGIRSFMPTKEQKAMGSTVEQRDCTMTVKPIPAPPAPPPGREVTDGKVEPVPAFSRTDVLTGRALKEGLAKLPELFGLTPLNRETMESRLFAVKEKFGAISAKNIVEDTGQAHKMKDIPADRIGAVIKVCDALLTPTKPVKSKAPHNCSTDGCGNSKNGFAAFPALGKVVDVALLMARNLADEKNFAEEHDRLHSPAFHVCRYCGVQKDVDAVLRWSHAEGCIVNTALQTIENYTEAGL